MRDNMELGAPVRVAGGRSVGRPSRRDVVPLLAWIGCLVASLTLLRLLGDGQLAAPDLTAPSSWGAWVASRTSAEVAVSLLRLTALALAWYLLGVTTVSVLARVLRAARLVRLADALAVGPVRHLVQQALGLSLAAGVLATTVPAPTGVAVGGPSTVTAAPVPPATVVAAPLDVDGPDTGVPAGVTEVRVEDGSVELLVPVPVPAPAEPVTMPPGVPADAPAADAPADAAVDDTPEVRSSPSQQRTVVVAPGDHLWALAEADVAAVLGRAPTDAEIVGHWRRVVGANTENLVVPGNPDLLRPGQTVVLPAVTTVVTP